MGADCFFRMGSTHQVCQDYARAGESGGYTFAALSDGCSSSPDTDFGARFLVQAFTQEVRDGQFTEEIASRAAWMSAAAGLPRSCLDATLLAAYLDREAYIRVVRTGDGVVAWRGRDGNWRYEQVSFGSNAPRYLSYKLDPRLEARQLELSPTVVRHSGSRERDETEWITTEVEQPSRNSPTGIERWSLPIEMVDTAIVFSDGVESFVDASGTAVPLERVLDELLAFKVMHGEFLSRRCTRFLKDCAKRGWAHTDDFSAAGIHIEEAT